MQVFRLISKLKPLFYILPFALYLITCANAYCAYPPNPHVSNKIWKKASPFFLPEDHPIKPGLDQLFSSSRVILDLKSLELAGFIDPKPRKFTRLIVTKHPDFPGYIFKIYLDAQRYHKMKEWECWIKRIKGVRLIKQIIEERQLQSYFKTPQKWIYPLPAEPSPSEDFIRKNFILVEEDMDLLDSESNEDLWGSSAITQDSFGRIF